MCAQSNVYPSMLRHICLWIMQEAAEYASKMGILFKEVSAKTGDNVNELFTDIGMCFGVIFVPSSGVS